MGDYIEIEMMGYSMISMCKEIRSLRKQVEDLTIERDKYSAWYKNASSDAGKIHQSWVNHVLNGELKFAKLDEHGNPVNPSKVNDEC